MTTRVCMENGVKEFCAKNDLEYDWSTEDGFLWIEIWGDKVGYKNVEELAKELAVTSGVNFYLAGARTNSFNGAFDCDRDDSSFKRSGGDLVSADPEIENYGQVFAAVA